MHAEMFNCLVCICVNRPICERERREKERKKESEMTWEGCDWWGVSKHVDLFRYHREHLFHMDE